MPNPPSPLFECRSPTWQSTIRALDKRIDFTSSTGRMHIISMYYMVYMLPNLKHFFLATANNLFEAFAVYIEYDFYY